LAPARVVYISTTGVYGAAQQVDHLTAVAPETARDRLRVEAEKRVAAGPWEHLILRPAAIYGPGRGVHHSFRLGKYREPTDHRIISRIHLDDLAAEVTAGLRGNVTGAFPVADEEPCRSIDVAILAAQVLGLPAPQKPASLTETGRRVDGSEFRRLSGVTLRFRSYREGVPDCLAAEL
jgi:nucleoside-diphosphate-sugar epimerase